SIHVPLNHETKYSVNREVLEQANGIYLINTARGDIVEPEAAIEMIDRGKIFGLGVDVWDSGELDDKFDKRLIKTNVMQTNHVGFLTKEAVQSIIEQTIDNIKGQPHEGNLL